MQIRTLRELNEHAELFWIEQHALMMARLQDPELYEMAFADMAAEAIRVPPTRRKSLEQALRDAVEVRRRVLTYQAKKGGKASKIDALQVKIQELVQQNPNLSEAKLKARLTRDAYPDLIEDVDEDEVWFKSHDGTSKSALIKGLKDRLYRAKKALKSR